MERKESPVIEQWRSPEEALTWANNFYQQISKSPRSNSRERKSTSYRLRQAAERIFNQPEFYDLVLSLWQSQEKEQEEPIIIPSFISSAKELIEKKPQTVTPKLAEEMIKAIAYGKQSAHTSHTLLKAYFEFGESNLESISRRLHTLLLASPNLLGDRRALTELVNITSFESDIIPPLSDTRINFITGLLTTIDNDELLYRLYIIDAVAQDLFVYSGRDPQDIVKSDEELVRSDRYKNKLNSVLGRLFRKFPPGLVQQRFTALADAQQIFSDITYMKNTRTTGMEEWPLYMIYTPSDDPLYKFKKDELGGLAESIKFINQAKAELLGRGIRDAVEFSYNRPDGYHIDVIVPQVNVHDRRGIIESIEKNVGVLKGVREDPSLHRGVADSLGIIARSQESTPYIFSIRPQTLSERSMHPIQGLELIGYPSINIPQTELPDFNDFLAEYLRYNQLRFLNRRGVRVLLEDYPELVDLGYQHIDFRRTAGGSDIEADINVHNLNYGIRLNGQTFEFDFEGRYFRSPALLDPLRYTLLSFLEPILCKERTKEDNGNGPDMQLEVVSRMGHLRLLPDGHRYTQRAVEICLRDQGRDLITIDRERKIAKNTDRYTTYVSLVIEKSEDLPLIELNLPGLLSFT